MSRIDQGLLRKRNLINAISVSLSVLAAAFGLFWLTWILWTTFSKGFEALSLDLFTKVTPPAGEDGGLANAIMGSLMMCSLALLIAIPIGIGAGLYLSEYARSSRFGSVLRFVNDILLSAPSIVLGLLVYGLIVAPMGGYSGFAGSVALALIAIPVILKTTFEMMQLVPSQMKEAALSLGVPVWKINVQILARAALPGIITGILLSLARISGETAPLLFTALNDQYWSTDMTKPMANLPNTIYQFASNPYEGWNKLAWAGALLITLFVLFISLLARIIFQKKTHND
jgi:phosphate transport system permease protein